MLEALDEIEEELSNSTSKQPCEIEETGAEKEELKVEEETQSKNEGIAGLTQRKAIIPVLSEAKESLTSKEILGRLTDSGFKFKSKHPEKALVVTLANLRDELVVSKDGRINRYLLPETGWEHS
ncbi:hypothetical protein MYX75_09500 [Acidobacteria bacterium AH-259-A15]|nr:hypothetical protein [Acidobacteria bacterium AH-259-A15]